MRYTYICTAEFVANLNSVPANLLLFTKRSSTSLTVKKNFLNTLLNKTKMICLNFEKKFTEWNKYLLKKFRSIQLILKKCLAIM